METKNNDLNSNGMDNPNKEFSKIDFNIDFTENLEDKPIQKKTNMKTDKIIDKNPIENEDKSISSIQENHTQINNNHQQELDRKWGLVEQLTNRSMFKAVQASRQELFNASAEYKSKYYKTILNGRLEALSEKTNTGLMMIKAEYRGQVGSFMMSKMANLAKEVKTRQFEFNTMMMEKHDELERLEKYPALKEPYQKSIIEEGERYMNFLDRLVLRFENIVDEQLQKYD